MYVRIKSIKMFPINNDQSKELSTENPIAIIRIYNVFKRKEEVWFQLDKNYLYCP